MNKISKEQMVATLKTLRGTNRIFGITFVKKNGELRNMVCRFDVKRHWRTPDGSGQRYNPADYGLVCVWDTQKQDYRSINLETIVSLRSDGVEYEVDAN